MISRETLIQRLAAEATDCHSWSNRPAETYAAHSHGHEKVLYCVTGSITFVLEDTGVRIELGPGDRLVVAAGRRHSALVGSAGCTCIEGRR